MPGKEVKKGTETVLTCSVTDIPAAVTITWWLDADNEITDSTDGKYSAGTYRDDVFKSMILRD